MKEIRDLGMVIVSTGVVAFLLTVFFDWRARLLSELHGEADEDVNEFRVYGKGVLS